MTDHCLSPSECDRPQADMIFNSGRWQPRPLSSKRTTLRRLAVQTLETRQLLATIALNDLNIDAATGEKPQSKLWQYDSQWWTVLSDEQGTWVWQLVDDTWEQTLQISDNNGVEADIRAEQNLAHVLLYDGTDSAYVTLQYSQQSGQYSLWNQFPEIVDVELSSGVETASLERDSTGRLWIAAATRDEVEVIYSDSPYEAWSEPIVLAEGIKNDDIAAITALPEGRIGVIWSDQHSERFGFRSRIDTDPVDSWSTLEIPAEEAARDVGNGMADDHLNVAVGSDGTLYVAAKTSYDQSSQPKLGLMIRRPEGSWDSEFYPVDYSGTRPIVVLDELQNRLLVAYSTHEGGSDIAYRESPLDSISFGEKVTLLDGNYNNVTSTRDVITHEVVFLASTSSKVSGVMLTADLFRATAQVIDRHVFYNNSDFDGYDSAANGADDQAIAADIHALLPGETSSAENVTSYVYGLNGLMLDIARLADPARVDLSDFQFQMADPADSTAWIPAPTPHTITVRTGAGLQGSDRITLLWNDQEITSTWLQVRLYASDHTGLESDDLFVFGNLPGDVIHSSPQGQVSGSDYLAVRHAMEHELPAGIDSKYDFNRDRLINEADLAIVAAHATILASALTPLKPFNPSGENTLLSEGESNQEHAMALAYEAIAMERESFRASRQSTSREYLFSLDHLLWEAIEH